MEENLQNEEGLSLLDIVTLLLGKIKLLILVALIGGFLGGIFAVWRTIDINYYGTTVEFYVNPEKPKQTSGEGSQYGVYGAYGRHVMDNMIKLLESESFTEELILNGAALPDMTKQWTKKTDKATLLTTKVSVAQALLAEQKLYDDAVEEKYALAADALAVLQEAWNDELATSVEYQGLSYSKAAYEGLMKKGFSYQTQLVLAYEAYEGESGAKAQYDSAVKDASEAKKDADAAIESALVVWRETENYASLLRQYKAAVSFSYLQADESVEDANNLARSFIYVTISVLGDNNKAFAENLLERVKVVVPAYVEENMTIPADYEGTNCQRITRTDNIALTNQGYTTNQAIKYAVLAAAAAVIIVCVIIIIIDRSDKRLRDYEIITKKFNVPVLGIVPTIEALQYDPNKKKADEKEVK